MDWIYHRNHILKFFSGNTANDLLADIKQILNEYGSDYILKKCRGVLTDTGSVAKNVNQQIVSRIKSLTGRETQSIYCSMHCAARLETYLIDDLSSKAQKVLNDVMMLLGTRQNVKFQRDFAGKEFQQYLSEKKL